MRRVPSIPVIMGGSPGHRAGATRDHARGPGGYQHISTLDPVQRPASIQQQRPLAVVFPRVEPVWRLVQLHCIDAVGGPVGALAPGALDSHRHSNCEPGVRCAPGAVHCAAHAPPYAADWRRCNSILFGTGAVADPQSGRPVDSLHHDWPAGVSSRNVHAGAHGDSAQDCGHRT